MTGSVAMLRAINVGGTGKLPKADPKALCGDAGFTRVQTYIASRNVVFVSRAAPANTVAKLVHMAASSNACLPLFARASDRRLRRINGSRP